MLLEKLIRTDQNWFWVVSFFWFLILELMLRLKLGVIFSVSFCWFFLLDWESKKLFGVGFSKNLAEKIIKGLYYAFLVSFLIFLFFSIFNILLRSFNNDWNFFQLP